MLDDKRTSNVDVTALTTTLVFQAGSTHRNKGVESDVLRVDDIANVGVGGRHAGRVAVDNLHNTEIGVVEVDRKRDRLAGRVLAVS